jgi:hypothetical protein
LGGGELVTRTPDEIKFHGNWQKFCLHNLYEKYIEKEKNLCRSLSCPFMEHCWDPVWFEIKKEGELPRLNHTVPKKECPRGLKSHLIGE